MLDVHNRRSSPMLSWRDIRGQLPIVEGSEVAPSGYDQRDAGLIPSRLLVARSRASVSYDLFQYPGVLSALAKVARGKLDVITFTNSWTALGGEATEAARSHGGVDAGWIASHAQTIERALTADDLLRRDDTEAIQQMVDNLPQHYAPSGERWAPPFFFATPLAFEMYSFPSANATDREIIERVIATTFNANLAGAQTSVRFAAGDFKQILVFSRPVVTVYWMAAAALSNGLVRHCDYCGAPFVLEEPRQRYCPPLAPWGKTSACSANKRKQRQRATLTQRSQSRSIGPTKAGPTDRRKRTI